MTQFFASPLQGEEVLSCLRKRGREKTFLQKGFSRRNAVEYVE
jgi:hypothetical protein